MPWLAAVALAVGLAGATPSPSVPSTGTVHDAVQVAAAPCLEHGRLVESVRAWLGRDEVATGIVVHVEPISGDGVRVQLEQNGRVVVERVLNPAPSQCNDRHAALGLLIAMAVDERVAEEAGLAPATPTAPPSEVSGPAPPARVGEDSERAPRLDARRRPDRPVDTKIPVALFGGPVVGFELTPGVAFGGHLGVSVGIASWLDLDVEALALGGLPFSLGEGTVRPTVAGGGIGLCPVRRFGRWQVRLCVSALAAAVIGRGRGFDEGLTTTLPWIAVRAAPDVRLRFGSRVQLGLSAGVATPILNARFELVNEGGIAVERRSIPGAAGVVGLDVVIDLRPDP